jgi:hypothetical protein
MNFGTHRNLPWIRRAMIYTWRSSTYRESIKELNIDDNLPKKLALHRRAHLVLISSTKKKICLAKEEKCYARVTISTVSVPEGHRGTTSLVHAYGARNHPEDHDPCGFPVGIYRTVCMNGTHISFTWANRSRDQGISPQMSQTSYTQ